MSLDINVDHVTEVLLTDGWHKVARASFDLDSYEYSWRGHQLHGGGNSGVCSTGFRFLENGPFGEFAIVGPLTSIVAVRYDEGDDE